VEVSTSTSSTGAEGRIQLTTIEGVKVSRPSWALNRRLRNSPPTAAEGWLFIVLPVYVPHQLFVFELN
jgi:hypothetical protein